MATITASLLPTQIDLQVKRETDFTIRFQLVDGSGQPQDISLDDVKFVAKGGFEGDVKIAQITSSAGGHADGPNGIVDIDITAANTSEASERTVETWKYEVRRVIGGGSGDEIVQVEGNFAIFPAVGN